jgi:hypothetical protein
MGAEIRCENVKWIELALNRADCFQHRQGSSCSARWSLLVRWAQGWAALMLLLAVARGAGTWRTGRHCTVARDSSTSGTVFLCISVNILVLCACVPRLPSCAFRAWCSIRTRGSCSFTFSKRPASVYSYILHEPRCCLLTYLLASFSVCTKTSLLL